MFGISCKSDTDFLIQCISFIVFETGESSDEGFVLHFRGTAMPHFSCLAKLSPSWNPTIVVGSSTLVVLPVQTTRTAQIGDPRQADREMNYVWAFKAQPRQGAPFKN